MVKKGYKELIQAVIEREREIIGDTAVTVVRKYLDCISLDEEGEVSEINCGGAEAFRNLYKKYREMGFGEAKLVIKKAIQPVLEKYPNLEVPEDLR